MRVLTYRRVTHSYCSAGRGGSARGFETGSRTANIHEFGDLRKAGVVEDTVKNTLSCGAFAKTMPQALSFGVPSSLLHPARTPVRPKSAGEGWAANSPAHFLGVWPQWLTF